MHIRMKQCMHITHGTILRTYITQLRVCYELLKYVHTV